MRLSRLLLPLFAMAFAAQAAAAPNVVTSIKPIDDLVRAVMDGVGEPVRLIPPGSSPHTYALKPSERLAAETADVLFWIGPEVETSLVKVSKSLRPSARIITLTEMPDIDLLPARKGGDWERKPRGDAHGHAHASSLDGHLWLSPANASMIVRAANATLSAADPANAERYAANAEKTIRRLAALNAELRDKLAPVQDKPFIVFHDAYQYFEHSYGLHAVGSILVNPEAMAGAKRVSEMRAKIKALGATCVFSEPQFEPKLVQTLIEGANARAGVLDPLGANLPSGLEGYESLLRNLSENLGGCLAATP
ncbi:MAG: zinc ABC transporter substrate-binding protein [Pseudomonadota bacterium]